MPILAVESNAVTPAAVFTVYACLGALPHANVRWTYGRAGRILISPAYHRIHRRRGGDARPDRLAAVAAARRAVRRPGHGERRTAGRWPLAVPVAARRSGDGAHLRIGTTAAGHELTAGGSTTQRISADPGG